MFEDYRKSLKHPQAEELFNLWVYRPLGWVFVRLVHRTPITGAFKGDGEYVEVLRGDTGMGYSDTTMLEYVLFLGEHGIGATFDSYPLEQIKIYVLKVEAGREEDARALLRTERRGSD